MAKVKVFTDSTADLSEEIRNQYQIGMVPLKVHLDGVEYLDGIELTTEEFYTRLPKTKRMPTTSQPAPGQFVEAYEPYLDQGMDVISIHLSEALSGTGHSARLAAQMVESKGQVLVIDSKNATLGLGFLVLTAAEMAQEGKTLSEIESVIQKMVSSTKLIFAIDTLEYLQKGGRIGRANALLGTLLNIKPILTLDDKGVVTPLDKVRGTKKALDKIATHFVEGAKGRNYTYGLLHGNNPDVLEDLIKRLEELGVTQKPKLISPISPVLGAHVGPGVIGITYYTEV